MKNIPTAEEFILNNYEVNYVNAEILKAMINFAKLHVEAALKQASEKSFAESSRSNITSKGRLEGKQGLICVHLGDVSVNKDSILNSYPLTLIN